MIFNVEIYRTNGTYELVNDHYKKIMIFAKIFSLWMSISEYRKKNCVDSFSVSSKIPHSNSNNYIEFASKRSLVNDIASIYIRLEDGYDYINKDRYVIEIKGLLVEIRELLTEVYEYLSNDPYSNLKYIGD